MSDLRDFYKTLEPLILQRFSFLTERGFGLEVNSDIRGVKEFIFQKEKLQITVLYEPFDLWVRIDETTPPRRIKQYSLPDNRISELLAASTTFDFDESLLNKHLSEIDKTLLHIATDVDHICA